MNTAEHHILARFFGRVESWPPAPARFLAVLSIPVFGYLDYLSGPDVAFSVFYLVPLSVIGWLSTDNPLFPQVAALLAAVTWLVADNATGVEYSSVAVPLWNTMSRLVIFLIVVMLLQNLQSALAEQRQLAESDPLTGVANARRFVDAIAAEISRSKRQASPISVAYIDVDDFKAINDSQRHAGGDAVLKNLAAALDDSTREIDIVGRLGGDEFAILLPMTDEAGSRVVIEQLRTRVAGAIKQMSFPVTLSIGCVTFLETPAGAGEILHAADELMYEVKKSGKDAVLHRVVESPSEAAV